jgi:hypothetical protein
MIEDPHKRSWSQPAAKEGGTSWIALFMMDEPMEHKSDLLTRTSSASMPGDSFLENV